MLDGRNEFGSRLRRRSSWISFAGASGSNTRQSRIEDNHRRGATIGKEPGSIPMDDPLALFRTWTTQGSWSPGDERGWVEKPVRFREPAAKREQDDMMD